MLLNIKKPSMEILGSFKKIPIIINQIQPYDQLVNVVLLLLSTKTCKVWILKLTLPNSWPHALQIMLRLINIGKQYFKSNLKDFAFPWYYKQPYGTFPKWII